MCLLNVREFYSKLPQRCFIALGFHYCSVCILSFCLYLCCSSWQQLPLLFFNKYSIKPCNWFLSLFLTLDLSTKQSLHTARLHLKQLDCPDEKPNFLMHMQHTFGCPRAESTLASNIWYRSAVETDAIRWIWVVFSEDCKNCFVILDLD